MKKIYLILLVLSIYSASYSQVETSNNWIDLFKNSNLDRTYENNSLSDSLVLRSGKKYYFKNYSQKLNCNNPKLNKIKIDSLTFLQDQIKYISLNKVTYINLIENNSKFSEFIPQMEKGNVNIYYKNIRHYISSPQLTYTFKTKDLYYENENLPLKKVTYKNLMNDFSQHPATMVYLDKYKTIKRNTTISYLASAGAFIGGVLAITSIPVENQLDPIDHPRAKLGRTLLVVSLVNIPITGTFSKIGKNKALNKAMLEVNN